MTAAVKASDSVPSKIVVDAGCFLRGLKAAKKIAGKNPYDVIQLRCKNASGVVDVCAMNAKATLMVSIYETFLEDIVRELDEVVEIDAARIGAILSMKFPTADGEENARIGVIISEKWVEITDESGMGIGVHKMRVPRADEVQLPGNPVESVRRARRQAWEKGQDSVDPFPAQLKAVSDVANCLGSRPTLKMIRNEADRPVYRLVAAASEWALTCTTLPDNDEPEDQDAVPEPDASRDQEALRLVDANPLGGVS